MELAEILSHKQKLFARMPYHEGVAHLQIGKLILIDARHLIDHRTFQMNHLVVRQHQNEIFTGGIGHAEGHLIVVIFAEIGI